MKKVDASIAIKTLQNILYKNGIYGIKAIAIISNLLRKIFSARLDLFDTKDYGTFYLKNNDYYKKTNIFKLMNSKEEHNFYEIFSSLRYTNKDDLLKELKLLIQEIDKADALPTDDFSVRVMQSFAKEISKNNSKYIDPCIGTGQLLRNLGCNISGYEIDDDFIEIAKAFLFFSNDCEDLDKKILNKNSLYENMENRNGLFVFDPPLNALLEIPEHYIREFLSYNNVYISNKIKIPSEYLFLTKIMADSYRSKDFSNKQSHYICMFTENFIFAQDKFKSSFRNFLLEKSINTIIKTSFKKGGVNKIILIGKANHNSEPIAQNRNIHLINFHTDNISDEILNSIVTRCSNNKSTGENEFYEYAKIKTVNVEELKENNYQLVMPEYYENEINPKDIKLLADIVRELSESNKQNRIESEKLEELLGNLSKGIRNISDNILKKTKKEILTIDKIKKNWYEELETEEAKALKIIMLNAHIIQKHPKGWLEVTFSTYSGWAQNILEPLKILFKYGRIKTEPDKFFINSNKNLPKDIKMDKSFIDLIHEYNFQKEKFLSNVQIKIYEKLLNYYFERKYLDIEINAEEDYLSEFSESDIVITLRTLKTLGVIKEYTEFQKSNKESIDVRNLDIISELYFPFKNIIEVDEDVRNFI